MQSKGYKLILLFLIVCTSLFPQEKKGYVTYQSSQYIYVKFDDTNGIKINDTLYVKVNNTLLPALLSTYISTRSCACKYLKNYNVKNGDEVIALTRENLSSSTGKGDDTRNKITVVKTLLNYSAKAKIRTRKNYTSKDKLMLSAQSYSIVSNINGLPNRQQWRYLLSADIHQVGGIPLIFSSYVTFKQRPGSFHNDIGRNLNVYDLSLNYDFSKDFNVVLGRKINGFISNIGMIDGLQFNKKWGNTNTGLILGSRPDLNYSSGVNFKLFETGVFIARKDSIISGTVENTLAFFEQTNSFKTDRRFIYFQNSNNIFHNFFTFISSEVDLFLLEKGEPRNVFNLTDLYFLLRYNLSKSINISASYDKRKNIIYYETFKNGLDSLIDRETRQGIRIELGLHPVKQVTITAGGGYNLKKGDNKPARNISAGVVLSNIPILKINSNLSFTTFENSFLIGNIYGITLSKEMAGGNLYPSISYRCSEYKINFAEKYFQNFIDLDLSLRLTNMIFSTFNYELEFEHKTSYNRLLISLSTRIW